MEDQAQLLARIATALEALAPATSLQVKWHEDDAFVWDAGGARGIPAITAPSLNLLRGIDKQKAAVVGNVDRLANGNPAHDMLLWGARGMGKSALLRSAVASTQDAGGNIAMVQVATDAVASLPKLFAILANEKRNFLVFLDDLGFAEGDSITPRHLRSWLDGGVEARPGNVRLAVTSNRRAIIARHTSEQDDPINPRDALDDNLALADRFGLSLGFHNASQEDYLDILHGYAAEYRLELDEAEALEWAKRRGARSGRIAWHFITELAGRAGKSLS
ncbi:MAG: ATP-binding protein [Alteraurantiacibacter sp.]